MIRALVLASMLAGCGPGGRSAPAAAPRLGGEVVAVVAGHAIRKQDVRALALAQGLSAREALTRLEDEAILADAARMRGLRVRDLDHRRRQVLAQLVLRAMERRTTTPDPSPEALVAARRSGYEALVESARRRTTIDYREPTVQRLFGQDALFERIR